jgi:quercetin dioxygenase-like cupin family protein
MATSHPGPTEPTEFTGPGVSVRVLAGSAETDDAWSLFEYAAEPGFSGPEPHWHDEMIEGCYILEGAVDFEIDGEERRAGPGEFVFVPRRTVHTFSVNSDAPARFLIPVSPGGFEGYFAELEELIADEDEWPPADMTPVLELLRRYDTHAPPVRADD